MGTRRFAAGACFALLVASAASAKSINWSPRAAMPRPLVGHKVVDVSGTLFLIGGGNGDSTNLTASVFAYSRQTNTWTQKASMPVPRMQFASAAIGNTIYVMGGYCGVGTSSTVTCLGYNTTTDVWFPIAPMPMPIEAAACVATPNNVFVFCGITRDTASQSNQTFQYTPVPNTWQIRAAVTQARISPVAAIAEGKIYLIGGYDNIGMTAIDDVDEFNPGTNLWTSRNPMPNARADAAVAAVGGTIYVMGGATGVPTNSVDILDAPRNVSWAGPPLGVVRVAPAAAFHQGVIHVTGGYNPYPTPLDTNEEGTLGVEVAGSVSPASVVAGNTFRVTLTVTYTGLGNIMSGTPSFQLNTSALSVTQTAGPNPAVAMIGAGIVQTFTWTFTGNSAGTVSMTLTFTGTDTITGKTFADRAVVSVTVATPPQPPVMVTALGSAGLVKLGWLPAVAGSNPVSGYRIYRTTSTAVSYAQIAGTLGAFATSYVDTTVTNGRPYLYLVESFDTSVPPLGGGPSASLTATPFLPPNAPTALTLRAMSAKIIVNWLPGAPGSFGLSEFSLWRRTGPGTDTEIDTPTGSTTWYNDVGLLNGTTYTYYMRQRDTFGNYSASSYSMSTAPRSGPFAPSTVTAVAGNERVILAWSAGSAGTFGPLSGYSVYRGFSPGTETFHAGPVYDEGYTDAGVANGSAYYYVVRSRDAKGNESVNSVEVGVTPSPGTVNPPTGVIATASAAGVTVSWVPAATGDPGVVGTPAQYAVLRSTCGACAPSSSEYVSGGTTVWQDPAGLSGGAVLVYSVRTRTTLGIESDGFAGVNTTPPVSFPLTAALSISPAAPVVGQTVTIVVTLTNTGGAMNDLQAADLGLFRGAGLVSSPNGPVPPASGPIPSGMGQSLTWTYQADATGVLGFTVTVTGFDQGTGVLVWVAASATLTIAAAPVVTPPSTVSTDPEVRLLETVKAGQMAVGPNKIGHATGAVVRIALKGNPGGRGNIRVFDEAGREVRVISVDLNGQGTAVVTYDAADAGGRPRAPGGYVLVAEGGGVSDRRMVVVRGKK